MVDFYIEFCQCSVSMDTSTAMSAPYFISSEGRDCGKQNY